MAGIIAPGTRTEQEENERNKQKTAVRINDGLSGSGDVSHLPSAMGEYVLPPDWAETPLADPLPPIDLLKTKYPALAPNIDRMRTRGLEDDYIEKRLAREEGKALFYLSPQEVGRRLGRTEQTQAAVTKYELAHKVDLYERARRYDVPREEIIDRIRAAGYLGVSESLLIKDDEMWGKLQKEYRLRESWGETLMKAWERERLSREAANLGFDMLANPFMTREGIAENRKRIEELEKQIAENRPAPLRSTAQDWIGGGAETALQMGKTQFRALPYGLGAAGAAFIGGQIGPQAAVPEEIITVPAAFSAGQAAGNFYEMFRMEAGSAFNEYLNLKDENGNPMDENSARAAAIIAGGLNAIIEQSQMSAFIEALPGGKRFAKYLAGDGMASLLKIPQVRSALANAAFDYGKNITAETFQEVVQEGVTIAAGEIAKLASEGNFAGMSMGEIVNRLSETAIESAKSFTVTMAPGAITNSVTGARDARTERRAAADAEKAAGELADEMERIDKEAAPDRVFVPRAAVETYAQENPGKLEEAGINVGPEAGTDTEVMMTLDQYEALQEKAPELAEAVRKDARKGAKGLTENEAVRKTGEFIDKAADAARNAKEAEETRRVAAHVAKMASDSGFDKDLSRAFGRVAASAARTLSKATGRPMTDFTSFGMVKTALEKWKENQEKRKNRGRTFAQTMDTDVDLNFRVPVMNIETETRKTITTEDRRDMAARFENEPVVNEDTGLNVTLSSGRRGASHIAHSAFKQEGEIKQALVAAFFHLPEIVQRARRVKTTGDRKAKDIAHSGKAGDVKTIRRFLYPMNYEGKVYVLKLTAKEYETGKAEIDLSDPESVKLYDQSIGKTISAASSNETAQGRNTLDGETIADIDNLSVGEMAVGVKDTMDTDEYLTRGEYEEQTGRPYIFEQFAGSYAAKTADRLKWAEAQKMFEAGAGNEEIRAATGWFRGMDNRWRFEIPDNLDKINFRKPKWTSETLYGRDGGVKYTSRLGDVYKNRELYKAYPDLKNIEIQLAVRDEGEVTTYGDANKNLIHIYMTRSDWENANYAFGREKETLVHEIQHAIQVREMFARGGSSNEFTEKTVSTPEMERLQNEMTALLNENPEYAELVRKSETLLPEQREERDSLRNIVIEKHMDTHMKYVDMQLAYEKARGGATITPYEQYRNLAGEIEARDTETRAGYDEKTRSAVEPYLPGGATVVYGGETVGSYSMKEGGENERESRPNAVTELMGEFVSMMSFFETANASSPFHEFMHHVLNIYDKLSDMDGVEDWVKQDFEIVLKDFGYTKEQFRNDEDIARDVHERFARGFEVYAATGQAPSRALRGVFENLKKWLIQVYGDARAVLGFELSDNMREVYDRLLATPEEIGAEYKKRTTVAEIAAETAAVSEAIERAEAEVRAEAEEETDQAESDVISRPKDGWTHKGREDRAERVQQIKTLTPVEITPTASTDKKRMEAVAEGFGEFENSTDKRKVDVPKNAIGKMINHKGFDISTIISNLKSLFETSVPAWSESEILRRGHKAHSNLKGYHHYVNKFTDGKNEYFIRFSVTERKGRQGKNGSSEVHSAAISDISVYRNDGNSQSVWESDPVLRNTPSFTDRRLQEFFNSVNLQSPRERLAALREKARILGEEKREINRAIKAVNRMADDGRIIWGVKQEIQKKLAGYDLKKRRKSTLERRAELEAYLAAHPEAGDTVSPEDLKYLGTRTIGKGLGQMSLADVEKLRDEVTEMYERGKREFAAWDAARQERIDKKNRALVDTLKKIEAKLPILRTSSSDTLKQYEGVRGRLEQAKDWAYSNTLGAQRFFDWLDGGNATYKGAFVKAFMDEFNAARDEELRHVFERREWMQARLKELGLNMRDFAKIRAEDVYGHNFTVDEIMEIYIGMRNQKKAAAILSGVFGDARVKDPKAEVNRLIRLLKPEEKKAAELVVEDHALNVDRIEARLVEAFNKGMDREENYTSIHRVEHGSDQGMIDADSAEALADGIGGAGALTRVEDGFMKRRVVVKDENQTGIKLGLFSNWHGDVNTHEHAAAFGGLARETVGALLAGDPAAKVHGVQKTVGRMIKERFGNEAWKTLVDYFNITVKDDTRAASAVLDGMAGFMARNMSVTYLAYNLGTVLKQLTSIPRFLLTAGPTNILMSIGEFVTSPEKFLNEVYELDPQMRDRAGSPILRALREDPNWGRRGYQRMLEIGMEPIAMMDRWVAAIGWKATYDANLKNLGKEGAIREAQRAVALTQQAPNAKDLPKIWRQKGIARLAMIFTSDAAQTFGMTAYDLVQQMRSGQGRKAFANILGLTLSAILMKAATDGPGDDEKPYEEEQGWLAWMGSAVSEQAVASIPLVGKDLMLLYDNMTGQYRGTQYSALVTPFERALRAARILNKDRIEEDEMWKASGYALEALSLGGLAPLPVTGMKRTARSLDAWMNEEDGWKAARVMVGMRR